MPRDGTGTRERIVERAAGVFNQRGFWGTSVTDLMKATGLEKGGLYHHFGSKEALAVEAFDHAYGLVKQRVRAALADVRDAPSRLHRYVDAHASVVDDPPFPGGCPLLNTAIDSDDTQPTLRERARAAMDEVLDDTLIRIIRRGIERGELRADLDVESEASLVISALEGGVMLSKLYGDASHLHRVVGRLHAHIDTLVSED